MILLYKIGALQMRLLKDIFNMRKLLVVEGKLFHVRYYAHVINLIGS
jgi:hypothetical protein